MFYFLDLLNLKIFYVLFILFIGMLFLFTSWFIILIDSPVHSILFLMFLFLYLTELTILFKFEFLGLIFIIVYIGAVCVLMLFHIKLIKFFENRFDNLNNKELFLPLISVIFFIPLLELITLKLTTSNNLIECFSNINFNYISWINIYDSFNSTQVLGFLIYNVYFIYLILGSFILFIAMVGSIYLTLIYKKEKNFQKISKQILKDISKIFFKK